MHTMLSGAPTRLSFSAAAAPRSCAAVVPTVRCIPASVPPVVPITSAVHDCTLG